MGSVNAMHQYCPHSDIGLPPRTDIGLNALVGGLLTNCSPAWIRLVYYPDLATQTTIRRQLPSDVKSHARGH